MATSTTLDAFVDDLDGLLLETVGLSVHDLPDMDFASAHEAGRAPSLATLADLADSVGETVLVDLLLGAAS